MNQALTSHSQRLRIVVTAIIANGLLAGSAHAANFSWLTSPSLVNRVTFDAFLGNADDQLFPPNPTIFFPGVNTIGAASQFSASNGVYGFFQGSHVLQGNSVFGLQDSVLFGSNVFQSIDLSGQGNLNSALLFNVPFTQSLNTNSPHTVTINNDHSYTDSFVMNDTGFGGRIQVTGTGHYFRRIENPSRLFSGDLLGHFNFVTPLLPTDWTGVAQESQTFTVLDGPRAGVTGFNTLTFFSEDEFSNPRKQPVALGAPWVITGYAIPTFTAGGAGAAIGSPPPPDGSGSDGTASLLSGNTASLTGLSIGNTQNGGGAGAVTVDGAGTQLSVASSTASQISVVNGSFTVKNGAHVDVNSSGGTNNNSLVQVFNRPSARLAIDGAGTELRVHGASGAFLGFAIEGNTGNNSVSIVQGATGSITNGARVIAEGVNTSAVLVGGLFGGQALSSLTVDGEGSTLDAGSGLLVGTHPTVIANFGGGVAAPGELIVRNGGVAQAALIFIGTDGTVKGNGGTFIGNVENHGIIAPGESPGTLNVQGDFAQGADGKLVIEIGGNTPGSLYDVLNVSGKLTLGGTLEIDLLNGFTPGANDVFDFLHAGSFEGSFANFILPTFGNGETLHLHFGPNGITATSAVPVPAAVWLLGSALGGLGFLRRISRASSLI